MSTLLSTESYVAMSTVPLFGSQNRLGLHVFSFVRGMWIRLYPFTVTLFILLMTEPFWLPILTRIDSHRAEIYSATTRSVSPVGKCESRFSHWASIMPGMVLAIVTGTYRLQMGYPLTGDAHYYFSVLQESTVHGIRSILSTDRPLLFLILQSTSSCFSIDPLHLLSYLPPLLTCVLVASTWLFVRYFFKDDGVAALSALIAAVSPHVTIGVNYFMIANWTALALMMMFYVCVFRSLESRSWRWAISSAVLFWSIAGIHFPCWGFCVLSLLGYAVIGRFTKDRSLHVDKCSFVKIMFVCTLMAIPIMIIALITPGICLGIQSLLSRAMVVFSRITPLNIVDFLKDDALLASYFAYGGYATPFTYVLAMIGLYRLFESRENSSKLILSWATMASVGLLVIPKFEQWRLLYMMPLEILAAFGLLHSLRSLGFLQRLAWHKHESFALGGALVVSLLLGGMPYLAPIPPLLAALVSSIMTCLLLRSMNVHQYRFYMGAGIVCSYLLLSLPAALCRLG